MDAGLQEITVMLPKNLVDYIRAEADRRKTGAADVLQQAIINDKYLRQQQSDGSKVLLEKNRALSKLTLS